MVGIRLARLETQALSASGHEPMVSGRVPRSGRRDLTYPKRSAGSSASNAFLLDKITETSPGTEDQEQYGDEAEQETDGLVFGRGGEG